MRRAAVWVTPLLILTLAVGAIGCGSAEGTTPTPISTPTATITLHTELILEADVRRSSENMESALKWETIVISEGEICELGTFLSS